MWTNREVRNLIYKTDAHNALGLLTLAPLSRSSAKVFSFWTQSAEKLLILKVSWLRVQTISFLILILHEGKKGMNWCFAGQDMKVWQPCSSRSQISLHSLFGVAQPLFPHRSTGHQEESWNQSATELQNLACNLDTLSWVCSNVIFSVGLSTATIHKRVHQMFFSSCCAFLFST